MEARAPDGLFEIGDRMPFGAIANTVLDREIDAYADEQHREIDRDQIEGADHEQAQRGGHRQADEQIDE